MADGHLPEWRAYSPAPSRSKQSSPPKSAESAESGKASEDFDFDQNVRDANVAEFEARIQELEEKVIECEEIILQKTDELTSLYDYVH